ncbi:hypothetical protein [Ancylomarina sp. 16SWW S1-10-2]|uniref:hypothetical protein n=1 Tax=Ancylomarina sp. 16SWW S1-10-2 TaxID=2499681 RepID=UPI0012AD2854|nr:hypothetical protein [Ancylomarina sp. 16SWW S1-10-2]MRT93175.1 hypothetical protein [Ancylomarina sp. 16SWW S1-10-2]
MTLENLIEDRINLIEKSKSIYFSQKEQLKFGINFIYYISIFFLVLGIIIAFLSSIQISTFSDRWMKSGLFYVCTAGFLFKVFGYAKYLVLEKHKLYLKQILNKKTNTEGLVSDSLNEELEKKIKSKIICFMQILVGSLAFLGGICFMFELEFWKQFDFIIFFTWSIYAILCFSKIQKLKQNISTFNIEFKNVEV